MLKGHHPPLATTESIYFRSKNTKSSKYKERENKCRYLWGYDAVSVEKKNLYEKKENYVFIPWEHFYGTFKKIGF